MLAKSETLVMAVLAGLSCRRAPERLFRAQSRGIIGTQFRFPLRAVWHFGRICTAIICLSPQRL
jgi:hypothetical protein